MQYYYRIRIRGLEPLVFRRPTEFVAAVHGPSVTSLSLDYPWPSTIAGALAAEAYRRGLCSPTRCENENSIYADLHECLSELLGDNFHLYTGLALHRRRGILYYTPLGFLDREGLKVYVDDPEHAKTRDVKARAITIPRISRTGIALRRNTKTVQHGYLYTIEMVDPLSAELEYLAIAAVKKSSIKLPSKTVSTFGGERKMAIIGIESLEERKFEETFILGDSKCNKWRLVLLAPALLDEWPQGWNPPLLDEENAKHIARRLTHGINATIVYVPKTSPTIEVITPGWCTLEERPRKPTPYIPPGTIIEVKADKNTIEHIVAEGIGVETKLGWGTLAAICTMQSQRS